MSSLGRGARYVVRLLNRLVHRHPLGLGKPAVIAPRHEPRTQRRQQRIAVAAGVALVLGVVNMTPPLILLLSHAAAVADQAIEYFCECGGRRLGRMKTW